MKPQILSNLKQTRTGVRMGFRSVGFGLGARRENGHALFTSGLENAIGKKPNTRHARQECLMCVEPKLMQEAALIRVDAGGRIISGIGWGWAQRVALGRRKDFALT